MALIQTYYCPKCQREDAGFTSSAGSECIVCDKCRAEQNELARERHFEVLSLLTMEERLRKVEEWIYDYRSRPRSPMRF